MSPRIAQQTGLEGIVSPAAKLQVVCSGRASFSVRNDVMEFQKCPLHAASRRADEGALAAVTCPHDPSNMRRHVAATRIARDKAMRSFGLGGPSAFHVSQTAPQGTLEDERRVPIRNDVPRDLLKPSKHFE